MVIFTKKNKAGKFGVRQFGHDFLIDQAEAEDLILKNQAYLKVNKPLRKLSEVM